MFPMRLRAPSPRPAATDPPSSPVAAGLELMTALRPPTCAVLDEGPAGGRRGQCPVRSPTRSTRRRPRHLMSIRDSVGECSVVVGGRVDLAPTRKLSPLESAGTPYPNPPRHGARAHRAHVSGCSQGSASGLGGRGEDAEFVALRSGQAPPRDVALAEVDVGGAEGPQPGHFRLQIVTGVLRVRWLPVISRPAARMVWSTAGTPGRRASGT